MINTLPHKLKVLGRPIKVKLVDRLADPEEPNAECAGMWNGYEQAIYISRVNDNHSIQETLLHEIIECINDKCDFRMPHTVLSTLSSVLYQIISDNKLDFLQSRKLND